MELLDSSQSNGEGEARDTLLILSGVALMVFGAGLILSNRLVRGYLGGMNIGSLVQAAAPDVQRYLKLRAM